MNVAAFYNEAEHLGNKFGVRGPFYTKLGHRGVDFNRHAKGTPIPSWTAGVVALSRWYTTLGWTVIVRRPDGTYAGFCHMQSMSPLSAGATVEVGTVVGKVGNTGTFTTGAHLHTTLEPTLSIGTAAAKDPLPHIRAAVSETPSTNTQRRGQNVSLFYTKNGKKNLFALAGESPGTPANWLETADQELANQLAVQHGNAAYLTPESFAAWKAAYLAPLDVKGGAPTGSFPKGFTGTFE